MHTNSNRLFLNTFLTVLFFTYGNIYAQEQSEAVFSGSKQELREFINSEMQYPDNALKQNIHGKVVLSFIVTPEGKICNIEVIESVNREIDNEAKRILRFLRYDPAIKYGKKVAARQTITIGFNPKKYLKACKLRGYERIIYPVEPVDTTYVIYQLKELEEAPVPLFPDDNGNFVEFIKNNLKYPAAAFNQNITGTVKLSFIIEPRGGVSHKRIAEAVGGGCDQEAIRILNLLKWIPGIKNGTAVRTFYTLEITFKLPEKSDHQYFPGNQNTSF